MMFDKTRFNQDVEAAQLPKISIEDARKIEDLVLDLWEERRRLSYPNLKLNSKKLKELQLEFIAGMVSVTDILTRAYETNASSMSPKVYFSAFRGDYIMKEKETKSPVEL